MKNFFVSICKKATVILKNKQGFTLVETIAGMAISTIILLSVVVVLPSFQKSYVNSIELSYSRIMANNIADVLKSQLAFSKVESCDSEKIVYYSNYSLSEDGKTTLVFGTENPQIDGLVYDSKYYLGKNVKVNVEEILPASSSSIREFTIHVTVKNTEGSGKTEYKAQRTVRQLNIK